MCRKYLPWNQLELLGKILGMQNDQKNTLLHEAAISGSLKDMFKVVHERVLNTEDMYLHSIKDALRKTNDDRLTFAAFALVTNTKEEDIIDLLESLQKEDIKEISRFLLHAAVESSKQKVVEYLVKKPTDTGNNPAGLNPLHIAAR